MKVYIGISWAALPYGKVIARDLERNGHTVTSHYLAPDFDPTAQDGGELDPRHAAKDIADLDAADVFLHVTGTNNPHATENVYAAEMLWPDKPKGAVLLESTSGGRHVEHGVAYQMGCEIIVLGPIENCFQAYTARFRCDYIQDVVRSLKEIETTRRNASEPLKSLDLLMGAVEREADQLIERHGEFESAYTGVRCIVNATNELVDRSCVEPARKSHASMRAAAIKLAAQAVRFAVQCCGGVKE